MRQPNKLIKSLPNAFSEPDLALAVRATFVENIKTLWRKFEAELSGCLATMKKAKIQLKQPPYKRFKSTQQPYTKKVPQKSQRKDQQSHYKVDKNAALKEGRNTPPPNVNTSVITVNNVNKICVGNFLVK